MPIKQHWLDCCGLQCHTLSSCPWQVFVWNALVSSSQLELTLSAEQIASLLGAESADSGDQVCSLAMWSTSG